MHDGTVRDPGAAYEGPISIEDVRAARERIGPWLSPTPLRAYAALDRAVGHGIHVLVKHENHQPTNAFKARNGLSAMTLLDPGAIGGVIAATRGNHGQGVAWAGGLLGIPVTICVPVGNNPEKNTAMRDLGAELIEEGRDFDEAVEVMQRLASERDLHVVHSTNNAGVIAGAGTITLEMLEQEPDLEALVVAVGGGSQAVGALTVIRALRPGIQVYAVQAEKAAAIHDSWHAGEPVAKDSADTFADGLATRNAYEMTFPALLSGLDGFITVSEAEIASAVRLILSATHNLAEGAGAAGLAGLMKLAPRLEGKKSAIILSGGNMDTPTLLRVLREEI